MDKNTLFLLKIAQKRLKIEKIIMEKDFVPYEQALALKELGFDEPCFAKYFQQDGNTPFIQIGEAEIEEAESAGNDITFECDAPLYQQAFRWFREKYRIEASVQRMPPEIYGKGKPTIKNYLLYIWAENLNPRGQQALHFDTYEEAELECLEKLIEIAQKEN